ncbi:ParB/RepB/Spo0J family partition protein [Brevundimonas sp.]|uniref:ParB/RepB/Spo0J family partition protein n=1 Tax=Brevundimonas sp. TaxID=1871086 RepID=UPI0035B45FDD
MTRSSSALAVVQTPFEATATRARQSIALREVDVAPENLRAGEPADDDIPLLADTLFAAGQLQPITVRPGRRRESPFMALDGRRRLLALRLLLEQGRIDDGFLVDVFVETDPARQAAAAVLTNTALPVHVADIIAAIGRMLKSRLTVPAMSRALGHAEVDIKRLAALSALPEVALDALRAGRMNLRQAKLLARLPDPAEQELLAQSALDGHGFADWRITEKLDRSQVTAADPRCALVSAEAYAASGGRTEADLFGERAPVLLDPAILTELWTARARSIAETFEFEGLTVHVAAAGEIDLPEDLETPGYVYGGMLPATEMDAYRDARAAHEAGADSVGLAISEAADAEDVDRAMVAMIRLGLAMDQIALGGRAVTTLVFSPSTRTGLKVKAWTPIEPERETGIGGTDEDPADVEAQTPAFVAPTADAPEPEVEGVGHSLHALRTDVATRGLMRALADDPRTALTALLTRLFLTVVQRGVPRSESVLAVSVQVFAPRGGRVIPDLDGVVHERIDARRAAWEASGQTAIRWIHDLADEDRLGLLAELTALTIDLREERTDLIRGAARAEASELAALSKAQITRHWTPDATFLAAHSKPMLLTMLADMGKAAPTTGVPGKAELVVLVEATAAARNWAPKALLWSAADDDGTDDPADAGADDAGGPGGGGRSRRRRSRCVRDHASGRGGDRPRGGVIGLWGRRTVVRRPRSSSDGGPSRRLKAVPAGRRKGREVPGEAGSGRSAPRRLRFQGD